MSDAGRQQEPERYTHQQHAEVLSWLFMEFASKGSAFEGQEVWYRGESQDCGWHLLPRVHRHPCWESEFGLLKRFQVKARTRYAACPREDDLASWLCLMQHHRLPTRLLDWTMSPLVAAYFAVGHEKPSGSAVIWMLAPGLLNAGQGFIGPGGQPIALLLTIAPAKEVVAAAFDGAPGPSKVLAVYPHEVAPRMMVQQSTFTIHGTRKAIDELEGHERFLSRVTIPGEKRGLLEAALRWVGIAGHNLFPDLDHLASAVADQEALAWQVTRLRNPSGAGGP